MSSKRVLIAGGAGFIGSHLADELLKHGYRVRALDNLSPQVHGGGLRRPEYLNEDVELVVGDVRDPEAVRNALAGWMRFITWRRRWAWGRACTRSRTTPA